MSRNASQSSPEISNLWLFPIVASLVLALSAHQDIAAVIIIGTGILFFHKHS